CLATPSGINLGFPQNDYPVSRALLSLSPHSSRSIMSRWFYREGELSQGDWHTVIDTNTPGWRHTGLRIGDVSEGQTFELGAGEVERLLVPLAGSFEGTYTPGSGDEGGGEETVSLEGRTSVFHGPPDVLYLPVGASAQIRGTGRVAVAEAPATTVHPARYIPKR